MNKILEYQKLDIELNKLKRSNLNSAERNNMTKLKSYIVETSNNGFKLETDAGAMLENYNKLKKQFDTNFDKVQKLVKLDMNSINIEDVDNILSTINSLSSELFMLERSINIIITKIKASLKEFEVTKNNIIKAKEKYKILKNKCEQDIQAISPRIKEIEEKMKTLENEIDVNLLAKYKTIKGDKIFPVFVSFDNGHCSGCRVEIPTSKVNKLKQEGKIICEQCHRIIYNK